MLVDCLLVFPNLIILLAQPTGPTGCRLQEQAKNGNAKDSAVPGAAAKSADKTAEVEMTHKSLTEVLGFVPSDASMLSHIASGNLDASPVGGANVFEPTTITLPDHVPFDFVAIREIMTELQAAIFRWAYSYESRKHMEDIYVDIPKPSPAVLCRFPCELTKEQDFCLPLAGTVSLTPSNHSLPLCVSRLQFGSGDWFRLVCANGDRTGQAMTVSCNLSL